jgi:hypothetical protein
MPDPNEEASMRQQPGLLAVCIVTGATALGSHGTALAAKPVEHLTAFAVDMSNSAIRTRAGTIDIVINRWSSDQERDQLVAALREGGADGLLRALQKIKDPAGYIRTPTSIGYELRFAREMPTAEGGRRIIIATDRYVSFLEATTQPRTADYPFMVVDIRFGPDGKGTGKLIPLAKISVNDDHTVEIENYASEPVRLTEVRELK